MFFLCMFKVFLLLIFAFICKKNIIVFLSLEKAENKNEIILIRTRYDCVGFFVIN